MNLRSVAPAALAAAAIGGAGGAAVVAVSGNGGTKTTTVVQQAPMTSSPASDTSGTALTPRDIYKRVAPGVAFVRSEIVQKTQSPFGNFFGPTEQRGEATGSGFVIDKNGDILTNAHVIDGAVKVTVQFTDNKQVDATVVGKDVSSDLALLKVDPDGLDLHPLTLGSAKDVQVGDPTIAIGNPFGLDRTLTTGVVSALQRRIQAPNGFSIRNVIQTDAAINPGNSGGPLLDAAGNVIGINSQIETGGSGTGNVGIGFAVPIDTAKQELSSLEKGQTVQRAELGVTTLTIDSSLSGLNLPVKSGVLIQSVQKNSAADKAGLKGGSIDAQVAGQDVTLGGDIITKVDGKAISTADDLANIIQGHKPGDKVTITYLRDNKSHDADVTLGKQSSAATQSLQG